MTKNELSDENKMWLWWSDIETRLNLDTQTSGAGAEKTDYLAIASLLAGSFYASSATQPMESHQKQQSEEGYKRMGESYPTTKDLIPDSKVKFLSIKNQPLGSLHNIIFWNQLQLDTLQTLNNDGYTVIMVGNNFKSIDIVLI